MNRKRAILIVNLFLVGSAWTELAPGQPQASELITKVYEIKWRTADDLASLLGSFPHTTVMRQQGKGSLTAEEPVANKMANATGSGQHIIGVSDVFNTITISAPPEQHLIFQELIRKHDTPPKRVLFQFYVLGARRQGEGTKNGLPASIQAVVDDISSLTQYRRFEVLGSPVITVNEGGGDPHSVAIKGKAILEVSGIRVVPAPDKTSIIVDKFRFEAGYEGLDNTLLFRFPGVTQRAPSLAELARFSTASIVTPFVAISGETLVVGTSHLSDTSELGDAVIIVVTPRVLE